MKQILTLVILASSLMSFAQETSKVNQKLDNTGNSEEYSVLKSDKKTRHGSYRKFGYKNRLVEKGFYRNGALDSTWTEYFNQGHFVKSVGWYSDGKKTGLWTEFYLIGKEYTIRSKGHFLNGQRVGIWEYFDPSNVLTQRFDHDSRELLYFKSDDLGPGETLVRFGKDEHLVKLERPPMYIGGEDAAGQEMMLAKLKYPLAAIDQGISGVVLISLFVDENGHAFDHRIQEGIGEGCDEEALRAVKAVPDNWLPGILDNSPVTSQYLFPVSFTLR